MCQPGAPEDLARQDGARGGDTGTPGRAGTPGSRSTTANKKRATLTQAGNVPARGGGEWPTAARLRPVQEGTVPGERGGVVT